MIISELFADLSYGELATLNLAEEGNGVITDAGKERIIRFINDGLLKLYSRFILKESNVLIEMVEWITQYHLLLKFAQSQQGVSTQTNLYIIDSELEPFPENVIRILTVYGGDGCVLPLNDEGNPFSLFTPKHNVLQVPNPQEGMPLSITYQAKHAPLVLAHEDATIDLPDVLVPALRNWIAYRAYDQVKTQEAQQMAQANRQEYENVCTEAIQLDLLGTSMANTTHRFERNGWR